MPKKILLLHDGAEAPPACAQLALELRNLGAQVEVRACAEPYEAVLDAVAQADSTLVWG